jgi:hypothetical protein
MKRGHALWVIFGLTVFFAAGGVAAAGDESNDDLVPMIVNLLGDKDREMRALGLQQVREAAKGPAATKRFVALLPKLPPDGQAALLDALASRGDLLARPAALEMLKSRTKEVRAAAVRALGALGNTADVPLLVDKLDSDGPERTAARASLVQLTGPDVGAAIVRKMKQSPPELRIKLLGVLGARRSSDAIPAILQSAQDDEAEVRVAAMGVLGRIGRPEDVPGMLKGLLKASPGGERDSAGIDIMLVCNRVPDADKRADPLLAAWRELGPEDRLSVLPTLGRVGGPAVLKVVTEAIADNEPQRHAAGVAAICLWPNASVAKQLIALARSEPDAGRRLLAERALIRVAALPDGRPDAQRLDLLKKAMSMATEDEDRNYVLKRAKAIRTIETLRFIAPYLNQPEFAQEACATVVELAHHRELREPNKAEFHQALDLVIRTSKDPSIVRRAQLYKQGRTLQ